MKWILVFLGVSFTIGEETTVLIEDMKMEEFNRLSVCMSMRDEYIKEGREIYYRLKIPNEEYRSLMLFLMKNLRCKPSRN